VPGKFVGFAPDVVNVWLATIGCGWHALVKVDSPLELSLVDDRPPVRSPVP
jgi:hypothetical protein